MLLRLAYVVAHLAFVSKKFLTPSITDAVVKKVNQKRVTNSKDLRKLRAIILDTVAREHFLSDEGDLELATLRLARGRRKRRAAASWTSTQW